MKICTKCGTEKPVSEYYLLRGKPQAECRECIKKRSREFVKNNYEKVQAKRRERNNVVSTENTKRACAWNKANISRRREIARRWASEYRAKNREKYLGYVRGWLKRKRDTDPKYRLNMNIRCAIWECLNGTKNRRRWQELVGYSLNELRTHLEIQFAEGMSWGNYGAWHVDHVRPIASFDFMVADDPGFKECWSLNNLQPLWAFDNLSKGSKVA